MRKIIILVVSILSFNLIACSPVIKPYRPPVQQGNIITPTMVQQIKVGMTKGQVLNILGEPVLLDPFDQNTWNYIYTFQPSNGPLQKKQLTIYFKNYRVSNYIVGIPRPNLGKKHWYK